MASLFLDQMKTESLERTGSATAGAALIAAVTVWALASLSIRLGYTSLDPAIVGFVCAAAAAWREEHLLRTLIMAAWGVVAGVAGMLLGAFAPMDMVPWIVTGGGVALAMSSLGHMPVRMIASLPAGALATVGGYIVGTYLLPVNDRQLTAYGTAGLAEPLAALTLVVIASLMTTGPHSGEPRIIVSRYRQKSSRHP